MMYGDVTVVNPSLRKIRRPDGDDGVVVRVRGVNDGVEKAPSTDDSGCDAIAATPMAAATAAVAKARGLGRRRPLRWDGLIIIIDEEILVDWLFLCLWDSSSIVEL